MVSEDLTNHKGHSYTVSSLYLPDSPLSSSPNPQFPKGLEVLPNTQFLTSSLLFLFRLEKAVKAAKEESLEQENPRKHLNHDQ